MAGQTERRIMKCVPPFLNKAKQFELLSFQMASLIREHERELRSTRTWASELTDKYSTLAAKVLQRDYDLDWFVKDVFPQAELDEFVNVFRYTTLDSLRESLTQVRKDLAMVHELTPTLDGTMEVSYRIALLDCPLYVDVCPQPNEPELDIPLPRPQFVTHFSDQYKRILLDHALLGRRIQHGEERNRQMAVSEVHAFIAELRTTKSDREYDLTLEVQGHGGTLCIRLQK